MAFSIMPQLRMVEGSLCRGVRLDNIGCLLSDGDDRRDRVSADLVREDGRIDDAEALDAEHA